MDEEKRGLDLLIVKCEMKKKKNDERKINEKYKSSKYRKLLNINK